MGSSTQFWKKEGFTTLTIFFFFLRLNLILIGAPYPPTNLAIKNCFNRTATLSWVTGAANNASITHFIIEQESNHEPSVFYNIKNVTNPNATSISFNLTGWATLRFRMRAVNRFGPSRASVATTKVCRTNAEGEYTFGFSTVTCVSEMWRSRTFPPLPPGQKKVKCTVADPDLQIRGGRGGHPHPEIRGGWSQKKLFSALRASVWSNNKRGTGPSTPLPWIRHCITLILVFRSKKMLTFESLGEITCCVSRSKSLQNLLGCFLILSSMLKHSWKRGDLKSLYF